MHAVGSPSAAVKEAGSQSSSILILCPPSAALGVESASAPTTARTPAVTADGTVLDHIVAPRAAAPSPGAACSLGGPSVPLTQRTAASRKPTIPKCGGRSSSRRYLSSIAVTPWPPAAQTEMTPEPDPLSSRKPRSYASRREGMPCGERGARDVEPGAVDRIERRIETEALLAEDRIVPRLQGGEHPRPEHRAGHHLAEALPRGRSARRDRRWPR